MERLPVSIDWNCCWQFWRWPQYEIFHLFLHTLSFSFRKIREEKQLGGYSEDFQEKPMLTIVDFSEKQNPNKRNSLGFDIGAKKRENED